jgi:hypothetical protein
VDKLKQLRQEVSADMLPGRFESMTDVARFVHFDIAIVRITGSLVSVVDELDAANVAKGFDEHVFVG